MLSIRNLFLCVFSVLLISVCSEAKVDGNGIVLKDEERTVSPSKDVEATFYLIKPIDSENLLAGKESKFLIGFENKGQNDMILHSIEPSLRDPSNFSVIMANLSLSY
ncbi:unnamed protein product [Bursaphelenchus okinawaensis]|uniref:Translocon-associated protein subunit alpha n=1 Tax=Bursaphelenchus okinawaensis TaxID=465554 RepID=A0A811JVJ4_9BILA|nr:unnamed protein product [Bursaphelenchus okinawaensis]CAG9085080.1 unnamed protein product [Bursaphelenchus okinawaensis]